MGSGHDCVYFSTVLGMLSYSAVLCHGHPTWGAPSGRWGQAGLLMWKGRIQVPITYDRAGWAAFPTQGLPIYIERFQKLPVRRHEPVQKHLILLTGGPGQSSQAWHSDMPTIAKILSTDVRGVGRSGRLCEEDDLTLWKTDRPLTPPHDPGCGPTGPMDPPAAPSGHGATSVHSSAGSPDRERLSQPL